jgi:hypothetical protein
MAATLLGTAGILLVLLLTTLLFKWLAETWHRQSFPALSAKEYKEMIGTPGLAVFEMLAWGMLFSLIMKRPLPAALLAVTAWSVSLHPFYYLNGRYDEFWKNYLCIVPERLVILAVVAAVDVWLGMRWLREESWLVRRRNRLRRQPMLEMPAGATIPEVESASRLKILGRLAWQSWRQTVWITTAVTALLLATSTVAIFAPHRESPVSLWGILIAIPLWTLLFFRDDQAGHRLRFFTERGVSPTLVWLGRQAAGLLPLAILLLIGFAVCLAFSFMFGYSLIGSEGHIPHLFRVDLREEFSKNPILFGWLPGLFLVYSAVQFCSLFFRSGILAGFFSLILTVLLLLWSVLMAYWTVPWWWSIAPVPLLLLLATWLRMPGWLLERRNLLAWLRPGLVLLPAAAIVIGVPFYRVYSVPWVAPGIPNPELTYSPMPEGLKTAKMYEQAYREYHEIEWKPSEGTAEKEVDRVPAWGPLPPLTEEEKKCLTENTKAIQLAREASRRSRCEFNTPKITPDRYHIYELGLLLFYHARQLEADGRPQAAWDDYLAALRTADHIGTGNNGTSFWDPLRLRGMVYQQLPFWATHEKTTVQDLRNALGELRRLPVTAAGLGEAVINDYWFNRALLRNSKDLFGPNDSREFKFQLWSRLLPWERFRAERLLNIQLHNDLSIVNDMESNMTANLPRQALIHMPPISMPFPYNWFLGYSWIEEDVYQNRWTNFLALYRATQIRLAMIAWKKERSKYPDKLEQVAEYFGGEIPRDPFSGMAFGYVPKGFCAPQILVHMPDSFNLKPSILEAGQPFLWSLGEKDQRQIYSSDIQELPGQEKYLIIGKEGPYHHQEVQMYEPKTEEEVWANGICYPMP